MNTCVVIPHFEHGALLPGVLAGLERFELPVIVVDDGSKATTRVGLADLAERYAWLEVVYRDSNGGKGAALKAGYRRAIERG
jgi:glycosyltransferase involved in cell wall biosynthesis